MLSGTEHLVIWCVYYIAALGLCWCWWRLTRALRYSFLIMIARAAVASLLFVPTVVSVTPSGAMASDAQITYFAPAFISIFFDTLTHSEQTLLQSSAPIILGFMVLIVLSTIERLLRHEGTKKA